MTLTVKLSEFLPYQLSVLSNRVSDGIAATYEARFGLTVPEWRVIAILAEFPDISAKQVAERTAMNKVAISRTVQKLLDGGRVTRESHDQDRRRSVLSLSDKGAEEYAKIAPLALAYERKLLATLSDRQQQELEKLLKKLADSQSRLDPHNLD